MATKITSALSMVVLFAVVLFAVIFTNNVNAQVYTPTSLIDGPIDHGGRIIGPVLPPIEQDINSRPAESDGILTPRERLSPVSPPEIARLYIVDEHGNVIFV